MHKRTTKLIPQLSQTLVKHPADILEYHSISLSVLMTQRIAGWSLLDSKVNVNTSYFLQSLADIQLGLAACHMAEQLDNKVRTSAERLAKLVRM